MSVVVVKGALRDQLFALTKGVELRDESGILIGRFVPPVFTAPELDLTEEELEQLLAPDRKRYTTAELLAYAKGLTSRSPSNRRTMLAISLPIFGSRRLLRIGTSLSRRLSNSNAIW